MRKLIYYVACSVDGYIARTDGSTEEFEIGGEHVNAQITNFPETIPGHLRQAMGVAAPNKHFDTVVMGLDTFRVGLRLGVTSPYPHLSQLLVSSSLQQSPDDQVQLLRSDPGTTLRELKQQEGKDIWLCGGGILASALFAEIDEVILKVNPFFLGSGIPLFATRVNATALRLRDIRRWDSGFLQLHYEMLRSRE